MQEPRAASGAAAQRGVLVDGVSRSYDARGRRVLALDGLSLHASPDEVVAVVGPSGCGKSTLLELVCRLQRPDAGRVEAGPAVLMPQRDLLLPWLGALDNAALPLRARGARRGPARERARADFVRAGLEGFERALPHELSSGMRQRVAFVRTLLAGKPVLALDEPFGALDALTRERMQDWLAGALTREPRTVLLVTHDVEEAAVLADRVVVLSARPGRAVATLELDGPRPRDRSGPEVVEAARRAREALR